MTDSDHMCVSENNFLLIDTMSQIPNSIGENFHLKKSFIKKEFLVKVCLE